ncbi:MAG: hypothetical protein WCO35_01830 [Candidatus Nomurabacteria bacterium]
MKNLSLFYFLFIVIILIGCKQGRVIKCVIASNSEIKIDTKSICNANYGDGSNTFFYIEVPVDTSGDGVTDLFLKLGEGGDNTATFIGQLRKESPNSDIYFEAVLLNSYGRNCYYANSYGFRNLK